MAYECIEYIVKDNVATIRLNRPERYNSFNKQMHTDMHAVLKEVASNLDLRCLVITGNGKAFCTGQDLNDRYAMVNSDIEPHLGDFLKQSFNLIVKALERLTIPVVAMVNGVAAGAGLSLALACDIVVAAKSAKFAMAFSKVGLIPDAGASWALVQALGVPRARALALLGETITAEEAAEYGLIWRSVEDNCLDVEMTKIINRLVQSPAVGLALTKRVVNAAATNDLANQLNQEAQLQTVAGRTEDYKEAVRAFVEKRPPTFLGK